MESILLLSIFLLFIILIVMPELIILLFMVIIAIPVYIVELIKDFFKGIENFIINIIKAFKGQK